MGRYLRTMTRYGAYSAAVRHEFSMLSRIVRLFGSVGRAAGASRAQRDTIRAVEQARRAISRGEFSAAEDILCTASGGGVDDVEALHLLGVVLNRTGRPERAAEILTSARKLAPDHERVYKELAVANLARCQLGSDLRKTLDALSQRLDSASPTPEVRRLLNAGMQMPGRNDPPEVIRAEVAFLLGAACLSVDEEGAELCSRILGGAEDADSQYAVFDLQIPMPDYCRKLGFPCKITGSLELSPMQRPRNPAAPAVPSFLCALPEGLVLGRSFIPAAKTGHAFPEQCIHNPRKLRWDNAARVFDMVRLAAGPRLLVSSSGTDSYDGRHLLVGNSENFGHWLLNHFSRLRHAEEEPALREAPLIVGDDIRPVHRQCLIRAGIAPEQLVYLRRGRIASFGELWVPSLLFCGLAGRDGMGGGLYWSSEAITFVRRRLRLDFSARPMRRIFVGRKDARWRRLINEAEIVEMLGRFGFETVDPGAMSLDEQIELAASAQIIVGAFGAGMNLLLFAPEGTPVVELKYDLEGVMDINWALTGTLRQPHHEIIGASHPTDPDFLKRDFTVAAERVRQVVEEALDSLGAPMNSSRMG